MAERVTVGKKILNVFSESGLDLNNRDLLAVLSVMDEGVLITDRDGHIIFYNGIHAMIDGLSQEEVLGKKITDVYDLTRKESLAMRCLNSGRSIIHESIIYKTKNGIVVNSINSLFPIKRDGKLIGCISFLKDYKVLQSMMNSPGMPLVKRTLQKKTRYNFDSIKGSAKPLLTAINNARKASISGSPIMLYGETGTGKEMFAQSIHNQRDRNKKAYVAVNCASIPETLFEGLLFGTEKGAYTGAVDKKGLFEQANGGTLFLDEIDSMPQALQAKLLRAIQEKTIRRVGGLEEIPVEIKIISSTNTPPHQHLNDNTGFRKDLFYRLAVVLIKIPPLREREDDVIELTRYFLDQFNTSMNKNVTSLSKELVGLFHNYNWPGNVREVEHVVEGAMNLMEDEKTLDVFHVSSYFRNVWPMFIESQGKKITSHDAPGQGCPQEIQVLRKAQPKSDNEKKEIEAALFESNGKIKQTAEKLGISRQLLYYRIKKHDLDRRSIQATCECKALSRALEQSGGSLPETAKRLDISLQMLNYKIKKFKPE